MNQEGKAVTTEAPPNETLYVNNINEKVKKDELRRALYAVFSQFGTVLDVLVKKTLKLRGQAFIIFRDVGSASNALRQMNNFLFYDKPMKVTFARAKSDLISKLQGTYTEREKRPRTERKKDKKPARQRAAKKKKTDGMDDEEEEEEGERGQTENDTASASSSSSSAPVPSAPSLPVPKAMPPNNKLFIQNLPEQANDMMLAMLFQQFPGFREVRMVPGNKGIAFVEFNSDLEAAVAMNGLQHFKITPTNLMVVSFAAK